MAPPAKDNPVMESMCKQRYGTVKWLLSILLGLAVVGIAGIGGVSVRNKALVEQMAGQVITMMHQQVELVRQVGELTGEVRKLNGGG